MAWAVGTVAAADQFKNVVESVMKANQKAAESQKRIDKLSEETSELLGQYRVVLEQIQSVRDYSAQVETLLESQREEINSLNEQIDNATSIGRDVTPLMLRMVDALEAFVELDLPFLIKERRDRVANLKNMMNRSDVSESEKFRRILEAYQIENEFGRTIEAYKGNLDLGDQQRTVHFLRIGRVAFVYFTLDEKHAGVWDKKNKNWIELPSEYRSSIKKGLRIANKQIAPDLIRLPIFAAEDAK
jgi:hypothetical protein